MNIKEIITTINDLPVDQRIKIADAIRQSLNPIDPDIERAWAEEAERRLQGYLDGETEGIPGEEVERRIREKLKARYTK